MCIASSIKSDFFVFTALSNSNLLWKWGTTSSFFPLIINKGDLVALDTTEKLLERIETKKIKFKVRNLNQFEKIKLDGVKFSKADSEIIAIYDKNKFKFDQIIDAVKNNAEILDISTDDGDLEDIFLQVTNR